MTPSSRLPALAAALLLSASAGAAELYKWVDERGIVNYSNAPPEKMKGSKPPTIVEDRTSTYTPERSVTEAMERNSRSRPPQPAVATAPLPSGGRVMAPPPPPPPGYDPCSNPGDPNCQIIYDGPGFAGRRRPPHLNQPNIPPGTIAGQSTGGGVIPGLSGQAPPLVPVQPRDRELERQSAPLRMPQHR